MRVQMQGVSESRLPFVRHYGGLALMLMLVAAVTATIVASCGTGGGSGSNGGLCEQCGDSPDGPCQSSAFVVPGATEPRPCPSADTTNPNHCESRALICRRKVDSAQQRCFPAQAGDPNNVDILFRCDGSRPGGTPRPPQVTPTSTAPTPTTAGTPVCGNGVVEGSEECDTTAPAGKTCADFCQGVAGGTLNCTTLCSLDFSACFGNPNCAF